MTSPWLFRPSFEWSRSKELRPLVLGRFKFGWIFLGAQSVLGHELVCFVVSEVKTGLVCWLVFGPVLIDICDLVNLTDFTKCLAFILTTRLVRIFLSEVMITIWHDQSHRKYLVFVTLTLNSLSCKSRWLFEIGTEKLTSVCYIDHVLVRRLVQIDTFNSHYYKTQILFLKR